MEAAAAACVREVTLALTSDSLLSWRAGFGPIH